MRRGGSIVQHDDDDDEDLSFEEDSQESPLGGRGGGFGANHGGYSRTAGSLSGVGSRGGYGGGSMGGGGDAYNFDIDMSKNTPFGGFDDDEFMPRRNGGGPSNGVGGSGFGRMSTSSLNSGSKTIPTAKAKAGLAKGGSMAEANRQFDLSRFERKAVVPSRAPAAAAKKPVSDDSDAEFEKFLNDSDNSDKPVVPQKTTAGTLAAKPKGISAVQEKERLEPKASTLRETRSTSKAEPSRKPLKAPAPSEPSENSIEDGSSEAPVPVRGGTAKQAVPVEAPKAAAARAASRSASRSVSEASPSRSESPRAYAQRSLPQSANSEFGSHRSRHSQRSKLSSPRSASSVGSGTGVFGKVMNAADFFAAAPAPAATRGAAAASGARPPPEVPSESASIENSVSEDVPQKAVVVVPKKQASVAASASSPCASRQASYGDDFHGESPAMVRAAATYDEDFEEDSASRPDDRPAPVASSVAVAAAQATRGAVATRLKQAAVAPASRGTVYTSFAGGCESVIEDDYRPRRPTEHIGVQAEFGVDVGVQCDPPAPEPAPADPMGMWSQASSPWFAAYGQPHPGAVFPGMPFAGGFGGGVMASHPGSMMGGMPFMSPYSAGLMAPGTGAPGPFSNPAVLRQLFALGSLKPGFTREAWAPTAAETKSCPSPATATLHPDLAAMSAIDESFRQQLDLLKAAASRHRTLLEQAKPQFGGAAGFADSGTAEAVARPAPAGRLFDGDVG